MTRAMYAARSIYNDEAFFSKSEARIRSNKARRQRIVRHQYGVLLITVTMILFLSFFMKMSFSSDAQSDDYIPAFKYYHTVTVHSGDTVWNIASDNYDDSHYDSIDSYISEICKINNFSNPDSLKAGENIIIPYYSAEFK